LKNIFIATFIVLLLAACGMSEGDPVIVLPNDSPFRSDISIARHGISSNAITGTFVKKDGDNVVISDAKGKFRTFNTSEVFSASDEHAQELSTARLEFYKVFSQNGDELDRPEILGLIKEKAEKAKLRDWVELLEVMPELKALNKKLKKTRPVPVALLGEWNDALDSLDDLEDEIAQLSKPNEGGMNFSQAFSGIMKVSVSRAINQWVGGYAQYKQAVQDKHYMNSNMPDLAALPTVIENAMRFASLRVKEAKHLALLQGKKMTDDQLDAVHRETMKTIIDATIVAAIKMANDELGNKLSGERLAEFLVDKVGYHKDDLAQFYGKKSWDNLLASVKEHDQWLSVLMADDWNGKIKINRGYNRINVLNSSLVFRFERSLLKPVAILSYGANTAMRGNVSKSKTGIQIKDDLGNWNWQGSLDDEGTLLVNGNLPQGYYKYDVHAKLYSPAAIKRIEAAKKEKIQQLTVQLKNEPWYGVTFFRYGQHWVPNPALIKLDFNRQSFVIQDIGFGSEKSANSSFTFEINTDAVGSIVDQAGAHTKHWNSGDRWSIAFNEEKHALMASIPRSGRNPEWKVEFMPESIYMDRLQLLAALAHSSWKTGLLDRNGDVSKRYAGSLMLANGSIKNNAVLLDGSFLYRKVSTPITYIVVPAMEHGAVLATLKIGKNRFRFTDDISYSNAPAEEHAVFRAWKSQWGYEKKSGAKLVTTAIPAKAKTEAPMTMQTQPDNALLQAARKQGLPDSRDNVSAAPRQQVIVAQPAKASVQHAVHTKSKAAAVKYKAVAHKSKHQNSGLSKAESQALNQGIKALEALL